jgi:hypothetical protein
MFKRWAFFGVMLAALTGALAQPASAGTYYFSLRFAPSQTPFLYLQFNEGVLRAAATPGGLARAKPIAAGQAENFGNGQFRNYHFSEITLPVKFSGSPEIRVTFLERERLFSGKKPEADLDGDFKLGGTDLTGNKWSYRVVNTAIGAAAPAQTEAILLPALQTFSLSIENRLTGGKVGIGLHAAADKVPLLEVSKNGKPAICGVTVLRDVSQIVARDRGDLAKFGFT